MIRKSILGEICCGKERQIETGSGSSPIRRLSISGVKQSPSPSSGVVSSELHSVHTKISLCFACHVMNKHDGLQTKLQALSVLVTDDVSWVQPFVPPRNDPSAQCTPTGG